MRISLNKGTNPKTKVELINKSKVIIVSKIIVLSKVCRLGLSHSGINLYRQMRPNFALCLMALCSLFLLQSKVFGQCPIPPTIDCSNGYSLTTLMSTLPECGTGTVELLGDVKNNTTCEDAAGLNCYEFIFQRDPGSVTQQFSLEIGQGNGCNGELDASYAVVDGTCTQLSNGGSQTVITFTFPFGVDELTLYLCVNSSANVTICNLCAEPPPCDPIPTCALEDITGYDCEVPPPFTNPEDVFLINANQCNVNLDLTYEDTGDSILCADGDGISITRVYSLYFEDPITSEFHKFAECVQNIQLDAIPVVTTCPVDMTVSACDYPDQAAFETIFDDWLSQFTLSNTGCDADSTDLTNVFTPDLCTSSDTTITISYSGADLCSSDSCEASFTFEAASGGVLSVNCPTPVNLPPCSTESEVLAAYNNWKGGFTTIGGCNITTNVAEIPPLPAFNCSQAINLSFSFAASDNCSGSSAVSCVSTFSVPAYNDDLIIQNCPSDESFPSCTPQSEVTLAFNTWIQAIQNISLIGGCYANALEISPDPTTITLPNACDPNGVNIVITATANDLCGYTEVCEMHFVIAPHPGDFTLPPDGQSVLQCADQITAPIPPSVNDACGNPVDIGEPQISPFPTCAGSVIYTYTYTDCAGNSHEWKYTYTISGPEAGELSYGGQTVFCADDIALGNLTINLGPDAQSGALPTTNDGVNNCFVHAILLINAGSNQIVDVQETMGVGPYFFDLSIFPSGDYYFSALAVYQSDLQNLPGIDPLNPNIEDLQSQFLADLNLALAGLCYEYEEDNNENIIINPNPETAISGGDQNECEEDPIQTLTAMAVPVAGSSIVWYDAPSGGNVVANPTLSMVGSVTYYAVNHDGITGCESTSRTAVNLTITEGPETAISGGDQMECEQDPIQTLTATATPSAGSTIVWYDAPTGGNVVANPTLSSVGSVTYYAVNQDGVTGCESTSRTAVNLTITEGPATAISGGDQMECEQDPIQTLIATATPSAGSTIVWYDAPSGGNVVTNPTLSIIGSVTYYAVNQDGLTGCESTSRTAVNLTITEGPATAISGGDQMECEQDPIQTLIATATPSAGSTIVWYDAPTGGNVVANPTLSSVGSVTYYAVNQDGLTGCESTSRTAVNLTITEGPETAISGGDQMECEQDPIQTLTATATPSAGSTIVWYDAPSGGNVVANPTLSMVGSVTYYAVNHDGITGCESTSRTAVNLTITEGPETAISGGDQMECEQDPIQTLTATATPSAGSTIVWYDAPTGGNVVANPTLSSVGSVTYYAVNHDGLTGCESTSRTAVNLTITEGPETAISGGDQMECEQDPIQTLTATATPSAGSTIVWYDAPTGGNVVANPTLSSVGSVTYYAVNQDGLTGW